MKLSIMSACLNKLSIEQAVAKCAELGLDQIELPCGPYPGDPWNLSTILKDAPRLAALKKTLVKNNISVSAIAVHGNVVHPDKTVATAADAAVHNGIALAKALDCGVVVAFSGCPAGSEKGTEPNFITAPWPPEMKAMSDYQWEKVLVPYWEKINTVAVEAGVVIAIESHPNMTVHNPVDVVRLHDACGVNIGGNLDPSHWFWQGIDPLAVVAYWAANNCLFYFHAKDARVRAESAKLCGVMAPVDFGDKANRPWVFCAVGVGHGAEWWAQLIGELATYGFGDISISLEHEDANMSLDDGLSAALGVLKAVVIRDTKADMRWAKKEEAQVGQEYEPADGSNMPSKAPVAAEGGGEQP